MKSAIGLCGAHRTGKTTLARQLAGALGIPFVVTSTSAVFAAHGIDPAETLDFTTRLFIQEKVLDAALEVWARAGSTPWITDRTPLDMLMYTLSDIGGNTQVDVDALATYSRRCHDAVNQLFSTLLLVQPGIPLVYEPGKAALNPAYQQHLTTCLLGLAHSQENIARFLVMPRSLVSMDGRLSWALQRIEQVVV